METMKLYNKFSLSGVVDIIKGLRVMFLEWLVLKYFQASTCNNQFSYIVIIFPIFNKYTVAHKM
jgi:hypothetical protein